MGFGDRGVSGPQRRDHGTRQGRTHRAYLIAITGFMAMTTPRAPSSPGTSLVMLSVITLSKFTPRFTPSERPEGALQRVSCGAATAVPKSSVQTPKKHDPGEPGCASSPGATAARSALRSGRSGRRPGRRCNPTSERTKGSSGRRLRSGELALESNGWSRSAGISARICVRSTRLHDPNLRQPARLADRRGTSGPSGNE